MGGRLDAVIANVVRINAHKRRLGTAFPRLRWQFVIFGHNEHEIAMARAMAETLDMEFFPKLSRDEAYSPVRDQDAVRRAVPQAAATRAEFHERTGQDYAEGICNQLWDSPQVNWDGKLLGCGRNFWGDFGANVFEDGLDAAVNSERIGYAREMLLGRTPAREDVPCTTCSIYQQMLARGRFMDRDPLARGQAVRLADAVRLAEAWSQAGRTADARAVCRRVLLAEPTHVGALRLLFALEAGTGGKPL